MAGLGQILAAAVVVVTLGDGVGKDRRVGGDSADRVFGDPSLSSPESIIDRLIWSDQTLCPAAARP